MPTQQSSTVPPAEFPQPHSGHLIDNLFDLVTGISARAAVIYQAVPAQPVLENCQYESPETAWGKCDGGWPCYHLAVVTHLGHEQEYCLPHFREVERG